MRKNNFLALFIGIGLMFLLNGCFAPGARIHTAISSAYTAYVPNDKATKNIQQVYNPVLDTQKQYPTGTVDVVFSDVAFKMASIHNIVAYLNGYVFNPSGSRYLTQETKEKILAYAKEIMPNVNFNIVDKPNFNSQNPQLILFTNYYMKQGDIVISTTLTPFVLTQAILETNSKYYLIDSRLQENTYPAVNYAAVFDNSLTYTIYYPIFPAVKAILLQAQNQPLSPYLANWLNAVKQWQPNPVGDNKMAFKVTDTPKLPCVYNYKWTEHKKDAQGKEYGKTIPEWYSQLQGIAPYLFMPQNSPQCQKIEKKVKDNTEITQAIMEVVAKDWEKETKPIIDHWDKYSKITVGADNATSVAKASE